MKIATIEDFSNIKTMALKFIETTGYKDFSSEEAIELCILNILHSPKDLAIILIDDGAFLAGQSVPFPFGQGHIATEIAWYVDPTTRGKGLGKQLLLSFEYWAKNIANCFAVSMGSLDDNLGSIYEKNGYKLYERAYLKVL